jgi:ribonuclease HI
MATSECKWEKPPYDVVKINIDASFRSLTRSGGWGAICRDSSPEIQSAAAGPLTMIIDAMHAEAMALSNAIQVAEQLGVGRVLFETDCSNLRPAMS